MGHGKRVDIARVELIKETSFIYQERQLKSPEDAYDLAKRLIGRSDREVLLLVCLNVKNEPQCVSTVSVGSLNRSVVHPREIFKIAILANSASIMMFHNHPSGDPTPSSEDINITKRINECGELFGIELLDHLIIGDGRYISLREEKYL